jgi:KUP system potassium uptake protein
MSADPARSGGTGDPPKSGANLTTEFIAAPVRQHIEAHPTGKRLLILSFTALGVVYGDIGTSPLYAIKECFKPLYGLAVTTANVYGVLSMIIWSLILIVTVKYVGFILRADNRGEGGVFALLALILQKPPEKGKLSRRTILIRPGSIAVS